MFDVAVNQHKVIHGLDIYDKVGRGTAHDEYVPFKVDGNRLLVDDEVLPFSSTLYVEFLKVIKHHNLTVEPHYFKVPRDMKNSLNSRVFK